MDIQQLDIQGHRGCRGLLPENSIPGFIKALDIGVHTLEMDVVVSKDNKVVVSHEPWISDEICILDKPTKAIEDLLKMEPDMIMEAFERSADTNIYKLNYDDIALFDCGSKPHPRFPEQQRMRVVKPLLLDVIASAEQYNRERDGAPILYNIEIKRKKVHDGIFHPDMKRFADLVIRVIDKGGVQDRTTVQCFDVETLNYIHDTYPSYQLVYLVENEDGINKNLEKLGFTPAIYSPYYKLLNKQEIKIAHNKNIRVIPWTVNERPDMQAMIDIGVDGIISDYPDRVVQLVNKIKSKY